MRWPIVKALLATGLALWMFAPARAQFGKNKITYRHFDWQVYASPHFDIHYYPDLEPFLEEVLSHVESAYLEISRKLDHELRYRVPLVIYRTHGEFQQTNILPIEIGEGTGAFAESIQGRMVLPIDLPPDKLYQLISHELTHIFEYSIFFDGYLGRAIRSSPPAWIMEGLASYIGQDEDNHDRMIIRDAVVNGSLPTIQSLNVPFFLTYRWGHAIFDFIEEQHGLESLRSFLFEYRKVLLANNIEKAIKETFGYDIDQFNRAFQRYLRKRYYPVLLEKKTPDDYGKEIGAKKLKRAWTYSPTISPSGELVAVLNNSKMEWDLLILSADDGKKIKNLTKGWTNHYERLISRAYYGGDKRNLSWSPVADEVAVFARRGNTWPLLIFNALRGNRVHEIVFDDIVQCNSPAFSPDGRRVAFEGNHDGVVDIFEVDVETKEVRNLTQDSLFDANPWYSADGQTLLYNRRIGSYWKVFSVDLADSEKKTQLTFGPSSDIQPSSSLDGKTVYFSSDRGPEGIFNIHAIELETGELRQYTDVVGGCFAPVEMAERDADRNLVFSAFYESRFRLYRMPLKEPEYRISVEERMATTTDAEPFEPPLSLRVDEPKKSPYKLKWDIGAPSISVGVTDDGTFLSNAAINFTDLMGNHNVQIVASTVAEFSNFNVLYYNLKRRFSWGASVYDFRDYFLTQEASGNLDRDQISRVTGLNSFIEYPLSRYYRVNASAGLLESSQDFLFVDPSFPGQLQSINSTDRFLSMNVGLTGDTTRYQSFGPFQGKRFNLRAWYAPHLSGDDPTGGNILEYRLDFRAYKQLTRRSLLAIRVSSIYNAGDRENQYAFGGINQLRGFDYRDFVGSQIAFANFEFRYPLIDILSLPVLNVFQIRGLVFLDVGAAWFGDDSWYDPEIGLIRPVEPFSFWNSDLDELQDGRASYGVGFQFRLFGGLQLNWVWAKRLDYSEFQGGEFVKVDGGDTRQQFYIVFDY